jgi:hypothetical protein
MVEEGPSFFRYKCRESLRKLCKSHNFLTIGQKVDQESCKDSLDKYF